MIRSSFRFSFLAMTAVLLSGCLKDISNEIPPTEPRITVNSFFNPSFPLIASVTRSTGILDSLGNQYLTDARVLLYEDGELVDSLIYFPQFQVHVASSFFIPKIGKSYKIEATAEGLNGVWAESFLPDSVPVQYVTKDTFFYAPSGANTYWLRFMFQDPVSESNLYHLMLYKNRLRPNGNWELEPIRFESADPVFNLFAREFPAGAFFSDASFNGQSKEILINTRMKINPQLNDSLQFILELRNCSAPYHVYNHTLHEYRNNQGDIFAQPGPIIGNISGGYGIFGGYAPASDTIKLN